MKNNTVIVRFTKTGDIEYLVNGENVRLLIISELTPLNRVYEYGTEITMRQVNDLLGNSIIASKNDVRSSRLKGDFTNPFTNRPCTLCGKAFEDHD